MVRCAAFDFEIRHRTRKEHMKDDGMSRQPLLKCAQCEICHQGAYETKRGKKVDLVTTKSSTQTEELSRVKTKGKTEFPPKVKLEGGKK